MADIIAPPNTIMSDDYILALGVANASIPYPEFVSLLAFRFLDFNGVRRVAYTFPALDTDNDTVSWETFHVDDKNQLIRDNAMQSPTVILVSQSLIYQGTDNRTWQVSLIRNQLGQFGITNTGPNAQVNFNDTIAIFDWDGTTVLLDLVYKPAEFPLCAQWITRYP